MKSALVIGNSEYEDATLAQLRSPAADTRALSEVLRDPGIGAFDEVSLSLNEPEAQVRRRISAFFAEKLPEDLLLLYFSGHGVLDERGQLYLAVKDTQRGMLRATGIPAGFITDEMDACRSKRQVLVLDCCYSGAFERRAKGEAQAVTQATFQGAGFGRAVLTASDSTQFALDGEQVKGQAELSLFTHYLIEGLRSGEADRDGDGLVMLDEWYDYTYDQVIHHTPKQTPCKWAYNQKGDLVIARNPKPRPAELPPELRQAVESPFAGVRAGAVKELGRLLAGSDAGLRLAASAALERLRQDDSRSVSQAAELQLILFVDPRGTAGGAAVQNEKESNEPVSKFPDNREKSKDEGVGPAPGDSFLDRDHSTQMEERYVDVGVPQQVFVNKAFNISILIRIVGDEGLIALVRSKKAYPVNEDGIVSRLASFEFTQDAKGTLQSIGVVIHIDSPNFSPKRQSQRIIVYPNKSSEVRDFLLTPQMDGDLVIGVRITQDKTTLLAQNVEVNSVFSGSDALASELDVISFHVPVSVRKRQTISTQLLEGKIQYRIAVLTGIFAVTAALIAGVFSLGDVLLPRFLVSRATQQAEIQQTAAAETSVALAAAATPSPTPTITRTPTITSTPTPTPTATFTPTPVPPRILLQQLIENEGLAVVTKDLDLIKSIFSPDAVRIDGDAGKPENAIRWYQTNFSPNNSGSQDYKKAVHENYHFDIGDKTAVVKNDSCGTFVINGKKKDYVGIQSDRWTFQQDEKGRWWVKEFAFNQPLPGPQVTFSFEEEQHTCLPWAIRYYDAQQQGKSLTVTQEQGYASKSALRFEFDSTKITLKRGQIVTYSMPFAGSASAYIYLPAGAPITLEAGFMAQDFEELPYNNHPPTQYIPLKPGEWTKVTWEVPVYVLKTWKTDPMHFVGLEIRDKKAVYNGYVLIDQITIKIH